MEVLDAGVRPKQGQTELAGIVCYPTCGLCRNRDNGASSQEVLLEHRLSRVHGGIRSGVREES